jgi:hypothetical protein
MDTNDTNDTNEILHLPLISCYNTNIQSIVLKENKKILNTKNNNLLDNLLADIKKTHHTATIQPTIHSNNKILSIESFIFRIVEWNFVWLIEQG